MIDTNLVLSALIFAQDRLTPLRLAWQNQRIRPLVSKDTAAELIRVLNYPKFKLSADDRQELLADYLPYCLSVVIPNPPPPTPDCRDAVDVPFLQLAAAGQADYLVTGDQDLLCLADSFNCSILSAEQFLQTLNP
ncbi:MAG: putative toxin-antitoxin system toxin component, PIN family [Gammaproteobacteria bacterium]